MAGSRQESRSDSELYAAAIDACACNNFRKASRAITQLFDQTLEPSGLRSTQLVLLLEILVAGSTTIPQLSRRLVMDRSTLQRNIAPLVERGLIEARAAERKGRSRIIHITERGREAVDTAVPLWERAQSSFVDHLGKRRWEELRRSLTVAVTAAKAD